MEATVTVMKSLKSEPSLKSGNLVEALAEENDRY